MDNKVIDNALNSHDSALKNIKYFLTKVSEQVLIQAIQPALIFDLSS